MDLIGKYEEKPFPRLREIIACMHATSEGYASEPLVADWWAMFQHDVAHMGYSTSSAPDTSETRFIVNYTTSHNGEWGGL